MSQQFNNISYKEQELLVLLVEEAAETVVAVAKALRHGFESRHPDHFRDDGQLTEEHEKEWPPQDNRYDIAKEAGQFVGVLDELRALRILDYEVVEKAKTRKMKDAAKYLHHQGDPK
jgi:hypothetical protein